MSQNRPTRINRLKTKWIPLVSAVIAGFGPWVTGQINWLKTHWVPLGSAMIAVLSVSFNIITEYRAEQLFGSQIRPLLQEQLTGVVSNVTTGAGGMTFDVVNYSGFDAYDVRYDVKFGINAWSFQWVAAKASRLEPLKKRTPKETFDWYAEKLMIIGQIKAGGRVEDQVITGSVNLDIVCQNREEGMIVLSRLIWKNKKGHAFDRIREFKLVCTSVDTGRAFAFIPQRIVARDE